MSWRAIFGLVACGVCIPVDAQSTNPSDPQTLWGQDTDAIIGKINKNLTDLQVQSETGMLAGQDFFTFNAFDAETQSITPVSRLDSSTPPLGLPADKLPIVPLLGDDSDGIDPDQYLPKKEGEFIGIRPSALAGDDISKNPNLASRVYDRIFNDGAKGTARLSARLFVASSTPTKPQPLTDKSVDDDSAILVNIDAPDWQQDSTTHSDTPAPLKKANTKQEPFKNIKIALENITAESTPSFISSLPRLQEVVSNAAKAVGYYEVKFRLKNAGKGTIDAIIDSVGEPVKIATHTLDIRGQMQTLPETQALLEQSAKPNDTFHHGVYESTKAKVNELGVQKGFFDGNWLEHSAEVLLPDNTADVNLIYESGDRYAFDEVVFFTVDQETKQLTANPAKLPVKLPLLQKLLTFETGDGFDGKKITQLSNELLATRYFNASNIETVLPEQGKTTAITFENEVQAVVLDDGEQVMAEISPIEFGVSDDLLAKLQEVSTKANRLANSPDDRVLNPSTKSSTSLLARLSDGIKTIVQAVLPDESGDELPELPADMTSRPTLAGRKTPAEVYQDKKVPLYVFVTADKPKDAQIGLGWGSDKGVRAMARLEDNLINRHGYQAGVEGFISEVDKGINFFASRPLSHPINDKLIANTKYFEEEIAQSVDNVNISSRSVESGLSRNIIKPTGWSRTYSLRYRLDDLETNAPRELWENLPVQFHTGRTTQEAVLVGASLSKTISDNLIAPTWGYRQYYSLELGSDKLVSDTDMAIFKSGLSGMASFGDNLYGKDRAHQLIGRLDLGYIWAKEFNGVPYKLRFFAGGDQSIRGYDYQSLSPHNRQGYLIGGQALAVGSLEYNYEVKEGLRLAVFGDVGGAYDKKFLDKELGKDTKLGVGVGVRFASPVGTVRVDIAKGIEDTKTPIRLHFLIGKPF